MGTMDAARQKQIRAIGLYLIVLLALVRFLVYPLHAALQERKLILGEQYEGYQLKHRLFERQSQSKGIKTVVNESAVLPFLYDKRLSYSYIQADILEQLLKLAEEKGLTVLNFEMMEPIIGKAVSEAPVLIRLSGQSGAFIEVLQAIENGKKARGVKSLEITRTREDLRFSLTLSAFRVEG